MSEKPLRDRVIERFMEATRDVEKFMASGHAYIKLPAIDQEAGLSQFTISRREIAALLIERAVADERYEDAAKLKEVIQSRSE